MMSFDAFASLPHGNINIKRKSGKARFTIHSCVQYEAMH